MVTPNPSSDYHPITLNLLSTSPVHTLVLFSRPTYHPTKYIPEYETRRYIKKKNVVLDSPRVVGDNRVPLREVLRACPPVPRLVPDPDPDPDHAMPCHHATPTQTHRQ